MITKIGYEYAMEKDAFVWGPLLGGAMKVGTGAAKAAYNLGNKWLSGQMGGQQALKSFGNTVGRTMQKNMPGVYNFANRGLTWARQNPDMIKNLAMYATVVPGMFGVLGDRFTRNSNVYA